MANDIIYIRVDGDACGHDVITYEGPVLEWEWTTEEIDGHIWKVLKFKEAGGK